MFDELKKTINRVKRLDLDEILLEVWRGEDVQEIIIDLNTKGQLFDKGIDSGGKDLGDYTPFTVEQKKISGLPFDRITLYQTGEFYESFYIAPGVKGFEIRANPQKEDGNLFEDFGGDILGLTADSKEQLSKILIEYVILQTKKRITT